MDQGRHRRGEVHRAREPLIARPAVAGPPAPRRGDARGADAFHQEGAVRSSSSSGATAAPVVAPTGHLGGQRAGVAAARREAPRAVRRRDRPLHPSDIRSPVRRRAGHCRRCRSSGPSPPRRQRRCAPSPARSRPSSSIRRRARWRPPRSSARPRMATCAPRSPRRGRARLPCTRPSPALQSPAPPRDHHAHLHSSRGSPSDHRVGPREAARFRSAPDCPTRG